MTWEMAETGLLERVAWTPLARGLRRRPGGRPGGGRGQSGFPEGEPKTNIPLASGGPNIKLGVNPSPTTPRTGRG